MPRTLRKKETLAQVFSSEFRENFENTIFIEHLKWMLLELYISIPDATQNNKYMKLYYT